MPALLFPPGGTGNRDESQRARERGPGGSGNPIVVSLAEHWQWQIDTEVGLEMNVEGRKGGLVPAPVGHGRLEFGLLVALVCCPGPWPQQQPSRFGGAVSHWQVCNFVDY